MLIRRDWTSSEASHSSIPARSLNDAPVLPTASRAASLDLKPLRINVCTVRLAFPVSVIAAAKPFRSLALESPTAMACTRTASIAHGSRYVMMSCKKSTPSPPKIEITSEAGRPCNQAANPSLQVGGIGSLGRKGATRQTKSANVATASTSPQAACASASAEPTTRARRLTKAPTRTPRSAFPVMFWRSRCSASSSLNAIAVRAASDSRACP